MSFDSHAHVDAHQLDAYREEILSGLPQAGVTGLMNVGCDLSSSLRSVALAKKYDFIYAAVGSHPDDADNFTDATLQMYRALAGEARVKAIGEIGLDYHYPDGPSREAQKDCFRKQLDLAREVKLPVILHIRDAFGDALEILADYPDLRGVFHCYSGSAELALQWTKKGWYIGFTGAITYPNSKKAAATAAAIPKDKILAETDCPYMAPVPFRGQKSDSRMIPYTVRCLAGLRGIPEEEMSRLTEQNAKALFRICE